MAFPVSNCEESRSSHKRDCASLAKINLSNFAAQSMIGPRVVVIFLIQLFWLLPRSDFVSIKDNNLEGFAELGGD